MAKDRALYIGPKLRRLRRELGVTQAGMAADVGVSASYIALMERNQRPVTADVLLRLANAYRFDLAQFARDDQAETEGRLVALLRDPVLADIDLSAAELVDAAATTPGLADAFIRLHTAYAEGQLALADRDETAGVSEADPVAETRRFLEARRNYFPALDEQSEAAALAIERAGGAAAYFRETHGLGVRRLPPEVMAGAVRRLDRHRSEIVVDNTLDAASSAFQLALQAAYLDLSDSLDAALTEGDFSSETGRRVARRALANYAAAAILMPYRPFLKAAEERRYDVEALGRQFGASFEQTAHRLTTLQKPGAEGVPFFFVRVDAAGNVSKRLDGAGFPFARHGGSCPLWSVHQVFRTPRTIVTQWLELPEGERFFSIARTVTSGGGAYGAPRAERAIALGCSGDHVHRLVYAEAGPGPDSATPIGVTCRLCHRADCIARAEPPIGRPVAPDDNRRTTAPFAFADR
ncbi:MAG: short-chain fatty acyl-CoA regulator family protein [Pseudomonadota bacterium]